MHAFYIRREYPTIAAVLEKAKEECGFPGGRFCLWRVLKEMGFTYKKRDNKKYIYEQTNILEQRHTYLQTIRKLRQEHKNLVYTDETWVNAHHNNEYIWVDSDGSGGWKVPSGKGRRLIILHAGWVDGWVEGADLIFRSKTKLNRLPRRNEQQTLHGMDDTTVHGHQEDITGKSQTTQTNTNLLDRQSSTRTWTYSATPSCGPL